MFLLQQQVCPNIIIRVLILKIKLLIRSLKFAQFEDEGFGSVGLGFFKSYFVF